MKAAHKAVVGAFGVVLIAVTCAAFLKPPDPLAAKLRFLDHYRLDSDFSGYSNTTRGGPVSYKHVMRRYSADISFKQAIDEVRQNVRVSPKFYSSDGRDYASFQADDTTLITVQRTELKDLALIHFQRMTELTILDRVKQRLGF